MKTKRFHANWVGLASLSIGLLFLTNLSAQETTFGPLPGQPGSATPGVQDEGLVIRPTDEPAIDGLPLVALPDLDRTEGLIMLNSKYAGWQEASAVSGGLGITDVLRGSWVMVDANGRFDGIVTAAEGADVTDMNIYLLHMGRKVNQTTLDESGRFDFRNVREGGYSLVGWGTKGFFAFGLNILANNPAAAASVQSSVNVTAFQNQTTINTDWIRHFAPGVHFRVYGNYRTEEGGNDPPSLFGIDGLGRNFPASIPATSISSQRVSTTEDGRLVGRVHQFNTLHGRPVDVRSTKVMLFEGDHVVASTSTNNLGVFEFHEVPDGSYGLLAAGVDGVGLIAIEVGTNDFETNELGEFAKRDAKIIDFTMVSSETIGWLNAFASEMAYQRSLMAPRRQLYNQSNYFCQQCGNRPGGCGACQGLANYYYCRSRAVSFGEWARKCNCPDTKPKPYGSESIGVHPNGAEPYGSQVPGAQPVPYYGTR